MIDYIKKNYLGLLAIIGIAVIFLISGKTTVIYQERKIGADETTTITNPWTFQKSTNLATTTVNALYTYSPTVFSTTTTGGVAATIMQKDLLAGQYWIVNIDQASDFTYTLPATSTLISFIPNAGERTEICFLNATSSEHNLIFAAGTGIDLEQATTTGLIAATNLALKSTNTGCIDFIRSGNASGTVRALFTGGVDAD